MLKRFGFPIALALSALLIGCGTVHGVGEDLEKGGQKIQSESNRHR